MNKIGKAINFFTVFLWGAAVVCTLLPFKMARDLSEPAHVLEFCGRNLCEVSAFWGVAVMLAPVLFIWLILCPLPARDKMLLSFPLTVYQTSALPAVMLDFRIWEAVNNMDLFTGYEIGFVLYAALSVSAVACTLVELRSQAQEKSE